MNREQWSRDFQLYEARAGRSSGGLATDQLPSREPSPDALLAEPGFVQSFFAELVHQSRAPLQTVVAYAQQLCDAGSAGISLVDATDADHPTLRLSAVSGPSKVASGRVLPLEETASGYCLTRGVPQLYRHPDRSFAPFRATSNPIIEGLFVPLSFEDEVLGTIWVTSHSERCAFDRENVRILENLGQLTAGALRISALITHYEDQLAEATARAASTDGMLRAHGEFVAELVHDLKNPITTIGLFAELGERSAADLRGSRRQPIMDALGHVRVGARRLTDLVGHLGQMTTTGTTASQPLTRTDLVALVQGIVAEQQIAAGGRIRAVVSASPINGPWAPISVQRIVGNLLDNAIKYSAPGRAITVSLGSEASPRGRPEAVLRVRDEGIGIPAQELPYVFDDLYRGSAAHEIAPGSGLGLASVKHLVELHGGTIEIRSAVHQGCEVCVRLPYDAA